MPETKRDIAILTLDEKLVVRSWDPWLAEATGITVEQAQGQPLGRLIGDLEQRGILDRIRHTIEQGVVEMLAPAFHHYLVRAAPREPSKHFEYMQQHVTITPLRDAARITGAILAIEDVTPRLERERDLTEQLSSPLESVRLRAAEALGRAEDLDRTALSRVLEDESWRVRREAASSLAREGGEEVVKTAIRLLREAHGNLGALASALHLLESVDFDVVGPLIELMDSPESDVRMQAALALGSRSEPRAVAALIRALADPDVNVRYHAIEALGKLAAPDAVEPLVELAQSDDFFLAYPALDALSRIGDPRIAPRLVPLLEKPVLRAAAAGLLGKLATDESVGPLAATLNRPNADAETIACALAEIHGRMERLYDDGTRVADRAAAEIAEAGLQALLAAAERAGEYSARDLALVLGWLRGEAVDRALARLLSQPTARREAIEALVHHGEEALELLVEKSKSADADTSRAAVVALGRIGSSAATPALVLALGGPAEVAIAAAEALARIGDRRAFESLIEKIGHSDAAVRQAVVSALNSIGHPDMAERARAAIDDPDPRVRESAVRIAGYFGLAECATLLIERCQDADEAVSRAAIEHLPFIEDERALPVLLAAVERGGAGARAAAARALAHVEARQAVSSLLAALADEDSWVRYFAARSLGRLRAAPSVDALSRAAVSDRAPQVRIAAIEALGAVGSAACVSVLASLAGAADRAQAGAALAALGHIPHPEARRRLETALRSEEAEIRIAAVRALGVQGPGVVTTLQWVAAADGDPGVVRAAIETLGVIPAPEGGTALVDLAADATRRELCITALAGFPPERIDVLARGLRHEHPGVRCAVVEALIRMKTGPATLLLDEALHDGDASVRLAAATGLVRLGSRSSDATLERLAWMDPDESVRRAARRALQNLA